MIVDLWPTRLVIGAAKGRKYRDQQQKNIKMPRRSRMGLILLTSAIAVESTNWTCIPIAEKTLHAGLVSRFSVHTDSTSEIVSAQGRAE
jgi:hypothetical protein